MNTSAILYLQRRFLFIYVLRSVSASPQADGFMLLPGKEQPRQAMWTTCTLLLRWTVNEILCKTHPSAFLTTTTANDGLNLVYTRDFLLSLQTTGNPPLDGLPEEVRKKPDPTPATSTGKPDLSNVWSLPSKKDELCLDCYCHEYKESSIIVFTDTCLRGDILDSLNHIERFSCVGTEYELNHPGRQEMVESGFTSKRFGANNNIFHNLDLNSRWWFGCWVQMRGCCP